MPFVNVINELVGHPLTYINTYLASEGMIAFQDQPGTQDMQLILDGGIFFEFIPFNNDNFDGEGNIQETPASHTIDEVEEDIEYAVIISTCAGAWRYHLGDTVRFTDTRQGRIVIAGRTKYYLNLVTEHLTGDNMIAAISSTEEELGIEIREFTIAPIQRDNYFEHHWYVGVDKDLDRQKLKESIDMHLKKVNDDYRAERNTALSMDLETVPTSYFYDWQQYANRAAGQSKVPRVIRGEALESWLAYLESRK